MFNRKKLIPQSRVVFVMTLQHYGKDSNGKESHDDNLKPSKHFYVPFRDKERGFTYNHDGIADYNYVRDFCMRVIDKEIAEELRELIDIPIREVKVNRTYEGSLKIVFSVFFNIYQFISGIAGFRDTIALIRNTVQRHMEKRLNDEFNTGGFRVSVDAEKDNHFESYLEDMFHFAFRKHGGILPVPTSEQDFRPTRDGFFWYLLISNIVLLCLLGILVGKAVFKLYF